MGIALEHIMKQFLVAICVIAIVANAVSGFLLDGDTSEWLDLNDDNDDVDLKDLKVIMPDKMLGDAGTYDYTSIIVLFYKNYTSGEYMRWTLTIKGQWTESIPRTKEIMDSYGDDRNTVDIVYTGDAKFTIVLEQNDTDPIIVNGDLNLKRTESGDLDNEKVLRSNNNVSLSITGLPSLPELPIPGGSLSYTGAMSMYPDPDEVVTTSLEEDIFGRGQQIKVNDSGQLIKASGDNEWQQLVYNWSVVSGMELSDFPTLEVEALATMDWGGNNYILCRWNVGNDPSMPVRSYMETNNSYEGDDTIFYIYAESDKVMHPNGFTKGSYDIPWDQGTGTPYAEIHNLAERESWSDSYLPHEGDLEDTSFELGCEEAMNFALDNSPELNEWLDEFDDGNRVISQRSWFNVTKLDRHRLDPEAKAGFYTWNLSLYYTPTEEERQEMREIWREGGKRPNWNYRISVQKNVERGLGGSYTEDTFISWETASNRSSGRRLRSEISTQLVTLETSEMIMRSYPPVEENLNIDPRTGKVEWEEGDRFEYSIMDMTSDNQWYAFRQTMIETLTGMATPSIDISFVLTQDSVWEGGQTYSVGIDAQNGRMVYHTRVEGTPLGALFDALE